MHIFLPNKSLKQYSKAKCELIDISSMQKQKEKTKSTA